METEQCLEDHVKFCLGKPVGLNGRLSVEISRRTHCLIIIVDK